MTALSIVGVAFFVVGLVAAPQRRRRRRRRLTRRMVEQAPRMVEQTPVRPAVRDARTVTCLMQRAARGAARLDRYFGTPTWDERIDLGRLRVASTTNCVLGQLFGNYVFAPERLATAGGFTGGTHMDRAWVDLISRRQAERREKVAV